MGKVSEAIAFSDSELSRGIVLDRDTHMAALWQDNEPNFVLDEGDLLIHQLGGKAEVITVSDFVEGGRNVRVWKRPEERESREVVFGGDINLDGVGDDEALQKFQAARG